MKSERTLDKLFTDANGDLAILITRSRQIRRWTTLMRKSLDNTLASHCYVGAFDDTVLTVFVDDAAWATRLRFQTTQLLSKLREANTVFSNLQRIQVKILNSDHSPEPRQTASPGPSLSTDNANIINTLSNSIDDSELQTALQRLARHGEKNKQ